MAKKLSGLELTAFTVWTCSCLFLTFILVQYLVPETFQPNAFIKEIVTYRSFFKRFAAIVLTFATFLALLISFQMWTIALKPDDFCNVQDSRTRWRNVNMKHKIESIEQIYDIPINVVNKLLYGETPLPVNGSSNFKR